MRWFWGLIIIIIGVIFLGVNLGLWDYVNISNLVELWPLAVILFGLGLMFNKWWWGFIPAILIFILVCFGMFYLLKANNINFWQMNQKAQKIMPFSAELPANVKKMKLEINTGAVNLKLSDGSKMIDGTLKSRSLTADLQVKVESDVAILTLDTPSNYEYFSGSNYLDLKMTDQIPVELIINAGASTINLDLAKIKLAGLTIKAGASTINMTAGEIENLAKLNFDAGASTIKLNFTKDQGVKIINESGLSTKVFPQFTLIGDNIYQSLNYDQMVKKCEVNFKTGVSTLEVKLDK